MSKIDDMRQEAMDIAEYCTRGGFNRNEKQGTSGLESLIQDYLDCESELRKLNYQVIECPTSYKSDGSVSLYRVVYK